MLDRKSPLNDALFQTRPVSPEDVHLHAWREIAQSSKHDPFDRYALYASRSLFVAHPEIYLRSDLHFYHHISSIPGYENAFLEDDRESMEFLPHAQYYRSPPFAFDLFPWDDTETTSFRSLYPQRYPFLPFVDRRMMPLASTLKTTQKTVSELEMASMRFIINAEERGNTEEVFVLYAEDERTWIANGDRLLCACTGEDVGWQALDGNIILIMNDNLAWYPLLGRDDTAQSPYLARLVSKLPDQTGKVSLLDEEIDLLDDIREASALSDSRQKSAAIIAAVRSTGRYTQWFEFHSLWDHALPARRVRAWQYYGYLEQFMIRANRLSPISAFIAACVQNADGYDKLLVVDREWIDLAALPNRNYVWGHLWDECLVEYTVDESFRIHSGHCMAQACIISACLTMGDIDNYLLEGEVPGSHHYVYVPQFEFTFDNGKLQSSQNTIHWNGPRGNKVIARFHYQGRFASPMGGGHYSGTFSPREAVDFLKHLKSLYGDSIPIYRSGDHETNKRRIDMSEIPTTENLDLLLEEKWEPLHLP